MLEQKASQIAIEAMNNDYNCCEAVLITANKIWNLKLSSETLAAAKYFRHGMGSGCSCGALVGLVMISGILAQQYAHPQGKEVAPYLYKRFQEQFGSSCCRVIRSKRTLIDRIGNRGCKQLTGTVAGIMVEAWHEVIVQGKRLGGVI